MIEAIIGGVVGFAVGWYSRWDTVKTLRDELHRSRVNEREATDRLLGAWKDGNMIPPRPLEPPKPLPPLSKALQDEVNQWADAEVRGEVEAKIRKMQAQGLGDENIIFQLGEPQL